MTNISNMRLKRAMQGWWKRAERARWQYGTLGRLNADGTVTVAADRSSYVWVTMNTGTLTQAYNKGNGAVPLRAGLPVRVREDGGRLIIDGEDTSGFLEGDENAPGSVYSVNDIGPDSHGNVALDPDDLDDTSTTHKFTTAAEITKLAGIEALADVTDAGNVGSSIHGSTLDTGPLDADEVPGLNSASSFALIRWTWTTIKAFLKTYFDTLYNLYVHPNHTGDVTSVGDGATTIVADAVTFAKMQNIPTDSLIGRDTASTGDPESITLGASLSMNGSQVLQRAALTGDVTAPVNSNATTIANDAVTTAKIINDAVTFAKIQNIATDSLIGRDTASSGDPENILLNATLSMDGSGNLQRAALTGDVTASAGSNATAIGANKVLTAMIADAQLTLAKMADLAADRIIGRANGAGTGVPQALTAAQVAAIINTALDHNVLTNLTTGDVHTHYALLAGRSGGQTLKGDTASGGNLTLMSTAHATKGKILFGSSGYDEVNNRLGVGTASPSVALDVAGLINGSGAGAHVLERTTSATNTLNGAQVLKATSSGSMADGFGTGFLYEVRDTDAVDNVIGITGAVRNGADNTGALTGFAYLAGVSKQVYWFDSNFQVFFNGLTSGGANSLGIKAGASTNDAAVGGGIYDDTTQTGNVGTGEDDLASYSVPANTLSTNGISLYFEAFGSLANNANNKRIRLRFGTSGVGLILDTASIIALSAVYNWTLVGRVVRTGAATQKGYATLIYSNPATGGSGTIIQELLTLNQTLSGAVTLKVTGEATANNDIVIESFRVWWDDHNT